MRTPRTTLGDTGHGRVDYSRAPGAIYFVSVEGSRWRIHDCVLEGGTLRRVGTPGASSGGDHRVFVADTGARKVYRRRRRELWELTEPHLDRQLAAAAVVLNEVHPAAGTAAP